jgi:hypothetical protein
MALNKNDKENIKQTAKETSIIVEDALRSISSQVGDIFRDALNNTSTFSKTLTRDIQGGLNSLAKSTDVIEKNLTKLTKGELTRAEVNKQIEARKIKLQSIEKQLEIASRNNLGNTKHLNEELAKTQAYEAEIVKALESQAAEADKIDKSIGSLGAATEGLSKGLQKAGLGALDTQLGLSKALASTKEMVAKNEGNISNLEASRHLTKEITKNITNSVDPAALVTLAFKELVNALSKTDKLAGDTAKAFNMSYSDALALNTQLTQTAALTGDAAVNTKGLNESVIAVGKSLGSNAILNEKDLITFTKLREQAGYTNDELIGIEKISLVNGKTLKDNTSEILGAAEAYASRNKLVVNEKDILKEVSKTSAAIKLSLGGSAAAVAEAVVKAKQFGLNLEQAEKIASGLLNFESSITNELEAELLTGKNLNFERARFLALNNDIAGAAEEIAKQVGTSADFANMNRIQQEAIAKAAGMERNELAQSLMDREALAALSETEGATAQEKFNNLVKQVGLEKAKKQLGNDQLANQFAQQSIAERYNNTIEKLREIFVSLAEPILQILSPFMDLLNVILPGITAALNVILIPIKFLGESIKAIVDYFHTGNMALTDMGKLLIGILGTYTLIKGIQFAITANQMAQGSLAARALITEKGTLAVLVAQAVAKAIGNPIAALAGLAIAGTIGAAIYSNVKSVDDAQISPDGGLMVSGKKGTYSLDPNDTVVAGTNLGRSPSSPSSTDIPMLNHLEKMNATLNAILNKEGVALFDTTRGGTAFGMGTYKVT